MRATYLSAAPSERGAAEQNRAAHRPPCPSTASQGWARKFDPPFDDADIGYGHDSDEVAAVRVRSADPLVDHHDAAHRASVDYVNTLPDNDFGRVVDERRDPPVTPAVRLVSVASDDLQHAGQAAFARGLPP